MTHKNEWLMKTREDVIRDVCENALKHNKEKWKDWEDYYSLGEGKKLEGK